MALIEAAWTRRRCVLSQVVRRRGAAQAQAGSADPQGHVGCHLLKGVDPSDHGRTPVNHGSPSRETRHVTVRDSA